MGLFIFVLVAIAAILIIRKAFKDAPAETNYYEGSYSSSDKDDVSFDYSSDDYKFDSEYYDKKKIPSEYLFPLVSIKNNHNYFARKKVYFTGDLNKYPDRETVAEILWGLGADIDTQLSARINMVVVGDNPGWETKIKLEELINLGNNIEIIEEERFLKLVSEQLDIDDADETSMEFSMQKFFVIGDFEYYTKPNIKLFIQDRGGEVLKHLAQKATILLIGDNPDFELIEKAKDWNAKGKSDITFSNEEQFLKLVFPDQIFKFDEPIGEKPFNGQRVLATGKLTHYTRDGIREMIILLGGTPVKSLSKKTRCVIMGDRPGPSKEEKIEQLINEGVDINIINEYEFMRIVKNATKKRFKN